MCELGKTTRKVNSTRLGGEKNKTAPRRKPCLECSLCGPFPRLCEYGEKIVRWKGETFEFAGNVFLAFQAKPRKQRRRLFQHKKGEEIAHEQEKGPRWCTANKEGSRLVEWEGGKKRFSGQLDQSEQPETHSHAGYTRHKGAHRGALAQQRLDTRHVHGTVVRYPP